MYTIYHIPGKKIGVTRNLNKRVTEQQGYAPDEYEVLFTSEDINHISTMEIELQKSYGYKVDIPMSIKQAERPINGQFRLKLGNISWYF